jgi:putative ABC transport system substrate-binding protein
VIVFRELVAAGAALGIDLKEVGVTDGADIRGAFDEVVRSGATAIALIDDPAILGHKELIVRTAAEKRLPLFSLSSEFVAAGGLQSYGARMVDVYGRAGQYVARILRGARPSELPVEQPTVFELAINLRTAKELGLAMPPALLARADEVIE